jgi:hypothetical protein
MEDTDDVVVTMCSAVREAPGTHRCRMGGGGGLTRHGGTQAAAAEALRQAAVTIFGVETRFRRAGGGCARSGAVGALLGGSLVAAVMQYAY